jgi:hypothetical protein
VILVKVYEEFLGERGEKKLYDETGFRQTLID